MPNSRSHLSSNFATVSLVVCQILLVSLASFVFCERTFLAIDSEDDISCRWGETPKCNNTEVGDSSDCFLVEVFTTASGSEQPVDSSGQGASDRLLSGDEWSRMTERLQKLANEDRIEDAYPMAMGILPAISGLRQRYCPVNYTTDLDANRFPMLMVQASCLHEKCANGDGDCVCQQVQQLRQVYRRWDNCRLVRPPSLDGDDEDGPYRYGDLFVKTFFPVNVNCAAVLHLQLP